MPKARLRGEKSLAFDRPIIVRGIRDPQGISVSA